MDRHLKPDPVMKDYWRNHRRFAALCNAIFFGGQEIILESSVMELDTNEATVINTNSNPQGLIRNRDLIKTVTINGKTVIIGLENQQTVYDKMVIRDLEYSSSRYTVQKKNNKDSILPVITIVMFYGSKTWQEVDSLKRLLDIPNEIASYFNDWHTLIYDAKTLDYHQIKDLEVRSFFEGLQELYNWNKDIRHLKDLKLTYETALAIGTVTKTTALINEAIEAKGGMINMCQAVDEALAEREIKGKRELIVMLLQNKLKGITPKAIDLLEQCNNSQLDTLALHIFDIETEEEITRLLN